uniref:transketolase n=1 Tax=Anopheles dirus TaxID=7168 RepID=A0A182N2B8_9DIPT
MPTYHKPEAKTIQELKDIAHKLRIDSINATQASKSGHPTSCASIAEIMSVLFFNTMRYKLSAPRDASSDRFILSKGHAAPILYAAWAEAGLFPVEDLMNLRKIDSDLEGHPTPRLNFIDVGTGSLGQGVAVACGMAYVGKNIDKADYRTYVLVGDGESAEGSIWESLHFAGYYKLNNLCVIFDVNRLGQSEATSLQHQMEVYRKRLDAFGFNAIVVDGHDVEELCKAFFEAASTTDRPTAIIAKTYKGKHFPNIEDLENWHGKPLGDAASDVVAHLQKLIRNPGPIAVAPPSPQKENAPKVSIKNVQLATPPAYQLGEQVATRLAYGTALAKIAMNNDRVIALDGDTKNSTYSDKLRKAFPERFIECFIAEQNLVGVAIGAACRDRTVAFVSTFATFFTRAFDQIRMGAISQTNVNFVGSHCGVSIGEDGPSQMGLEDIAMFRAIPGSTVFYPADAVSTERAVEMAANTAGVCFIRTSRPNTAVIYDNNEKFEIGKCKVVKQSASDSVLLIGAGITLYEALKAAEELEKSGIHCRVIDPFTVKPLDREGIVHHGAQCGGRVVVVEDHYKQGGLGEAVLSALAEQRNFVVKHLGVDKLPRSGPPTVLVDMFGISARSVAAAVQEIIKLIKMEEDTEYKKLPIDERCVHKLWKARVDGYEQAAKLFRTIDDEKSPEWNKYLGLIKKFVVDSNAVAQEKGLETTLVFVENSGNAGKTVGEVMGGIVTKCIGAPKTKTKELAVQITLMYVEIERQDTNPSVKMETATFLARAFTKTLPTALSKKILKPLIAALLKTLNEPDPSVRDAAADAIGTAMKLVGDKTIGPYLTEVDALKMAKIKESCEPAVITVKIPAARKEVRPATERPKTAGVTTRKAPSETKVVSGGGGSATVQRPATAATTAKKVVSGGGLKKSATGGSLGGRGGGNGGPKAGTIQPVANTENDLLQSEIDERASELLPADAIRGLMDGNWKTRLGAVESFAMVVPGLEVKPNLTQVLLRTLARKPGFKDTNFQVLKGKLDAARIAIERYGITTTTAEYVLQEVTEKLADAKNGPAAAAVLTAIAEGGAGLDYTVQNVMEFAFEQQKSPKVQQEALVWVATALREFGLQVEAKALIENARKGVQSIFPAVRTAGIGLLGTMYLFMGQPLTMFFDSEKPALKQQIMAEFERCAGQKPSAPTRGFAGKAIAGGGDNDDNDAMGEEDGAAASPAINLNDLLPRIDISGQITEALLTELSDKNWKTRNEGLVRLQTIIAEAKLIKPTLGDLPQVLAQLLVDINAKIAQTSVEICQQMAVAMGPPCRQYVRAFFPGFLKGLGDGKSFIRSACLACINTWGEQAGYKDFFDGEMIPDALKTGSPPLRTELYAWLAEKLPNLTPKSILKDELVAILPHLYTHITDRSADVRKNANEAVLGVMIHLGYDAMVKALDKQKPISKKDIQAALDKARPNLPVKALPPPKAPAATEESSGGKAGGLKLKAPKSAGAAGAAGRLGGGAGSGGLDKTGGSSGGASGAGGSASSAGSSSRKKEEDADSLAPLLAVNGLKKQRLVDEQKLKVLKWTFTTPREEFYELLKEQMQTANVNKSLMVNMFHDDFRYHLKVIDALMEDLATNEEALVCNLDLVMKWLSLRFYDTNPSVLLKGLEYLNQVFQRLVDRQYVLADIEGSSFVPHLLIKIGDPKDVVRNGVRTLLRQICLLYPFSKVFVFIMNALKSKNARQRAECLDELGYLIETYGLTVCQPSQPVALKEIARHISDRDNAVRNAALNAVVQAYFLAGEKIYKLIGRLSDKDLSMLDERIKRSKKASVLPTKKLPVVGPGTGANLNETAAVIVPKESILPVQELPGAVAGGEGAVDAAMDEDETLVQPHADRVVVPMKIIVPALAQPRVVKGPFKLDENVIADIERNWVRVDELGKTVLSPLDDTFIFDELVVIAVNGISYPEDKYQQLTQRNLLSSAGSGGPGESPVHHQHTVSSIRSSLDGSGLVPKAKPTPASGQSLTDALPKLDQNLVRIIRGIANTDSYAAHAALNELTDILQPPEKQAVLRGYEEMYIQSVLQQFKNIQQKPIAESMNIFQPLLHSIFMFFASKSLGKHLTMVSIKNIISVLLGLMADNRLVTGIDDAQFVKVVNGICLKILDRTNFTYMNCALIRLLKESCQTSCLPKFIDLQMKCIWRNVKVIPDRLAELDYEAILLEVHDFMLTLPSHWWQGRPSDMPLRTVKTIVHNLAKIKGNAILPHLNTIPTRSELYSYVLRILKNINKDAPAGAMAGDGEAGAGNTSSLLRPGTAAGISAAQHNALNSDNNNHGSRSSMIGGDGDGNNTSVVGSEYQKYIAVNASVEGESGKGGPQNRQNPDFWMERLNNLIKKTTVSGQSTRGSLLGATSTQLSLDGATFGTTTTMGAGIITDENLNLNQLAGGKFNIRAGLGHEPTNLTGTPMGGSTTSQRRELLQQKLEQLKQHK